jgi:hypothetical protein
MGTYPVHPAARRVASVVTHQAPADLDMRDAGMRQSYQRQALAARAAARVRLDAMVIRVNHSNAYL